MDTTNPFHVSPESKVNFSVNTGLMTMPKKSQFSNLKVEPPFNKMPNISRIFLLFIPHGSLNALEGEKQVYPSIKVFLDG